MQRLIDVLFSADGEEGLGEDDDPSLTSYVLATLPSLVNRLPEREKICLTLYYYEELQLSEIGLVLGITESRVAQLHTRAIQQLRRMLGGAR